MRLNRFGWLLLLLPWFAFASKPCERVIVMDTDTVLEGISLMPPRGVTLKFPFDLNDAETFYSISDISWVNFTKSQGTNLVSVLFQALDKNAFGQQVDLTIGTQDFSFVLTLNIDPRAKDYCPLVSFEMSDALIAVMDKKASEKKAALEAHQGEKDRLDKLAQRKAFNLFSRLVGVKPKKVRVNEIQMVEVDKKQRVIVEVDTIKEYGDISVIHGKVINDTRSGDLSVSLIRLVKAGNGANYTDAFSIDDNVIQKGKASRFRVVTDASNVQRGAEIAVTTSKARVKVGW